MNIIFFSHPDFAGHQSMPRLTRMFAEGMEKRGHTTAIWSPQAKFFNLRILRGLKKWLGYVDQYILFPRQVKSRLKSVPVETLFIFTDQALGPWIPLVAGRPHIVHCNDFLAQKSALGLISENPVSWSGKKYQSYIRNGLQKGQNFISISNKTKHDLHKVLSLQSVMSKVVYLGLNNRFEPLDKVQSRSLFGSKMGIDLSIGYLLHVGGNQWYKNRIGIIEMYDAWRTTYQDVRLPLVLVGEGPSLRLIERCNQCAFKDDIHFFTKVDDEVVRSAYAGASIFIFPSLAEGFGWPIAEAMACGCPVITTDEAPMTEVAGDAAFFIKRRPDDTDGAKMWAIESADVINKIMELSTEAYNNLIEKGLENAKRFDAENALNQIEEIYKSVADGVKTT